MTLTKSIGLSILKYALGFAGTFIIGKNLPAFGAATTETVQIIVGSILTLVSLFWGFFDGSTTLEAFSSGIKAAIVGVGGLLVAAGKLSQDKLDALIALVTSLGPVIVSQMQKITNIKVADPNQSNIVINPTSGRVVDLTKKAA